MTRDDWQDILLGLGDASNALYIIWDEVGADYNGDFAELDRTIDQALGQAQALEHRLFDEPDGPLHDTLEEQRGER